jgi:diguanylate cyclase (GGDEF)-like protein
MSSAQLRILSLDQPLLPPRLGEVRSANHAASAAELVASFRPDVIAVDVASAWAGDFVRGLPAATRPAVIAFGAAPSSDAEVYDEWLAGTAPEEEAHTRVRLALARAGSRQRAARLAYVDPLTGLPNRRALLRALAREAARARRHGGDVALVLVDLDYFKQVNERQGHPAGDRVLRDVGRQLAAATRREELCARIGGDEFAIVVAGGLQQAEAAARRVRDALASIEVEATVVACDLRAGERLQDLYVRADNRLRAEKRARHQAGDHAA